MKLPGEKCQSESEVREAQRLLGELERKTGLRADEVATTDFIFTQLLGMMSGSRETWSIS